MIKNYHELRKILRIFASLFLISFFVGLVVAETVSRLIVNNDDSFISDANNNGLADTGDVIRYTVTIANCGDIANNVEYNASIDPNTSLIPSSLAQSGLEDSSICGQVQPPEDGGSGSIPTSREARAVDDIFQVSNGGTISDDVMTNDIGPAPLTVISYGDTLANVATNLPNAVLSLPAGGGTIDVSIASDGTISITASGTTGSGSVTLFYRMRASNGTRDTASITIYFGDFPVAVDDSNVTLGVSAYTTTAGTPISIPAGIGLLGNDLLGSPVATLTFFGGGNASPSVNRPAGTTRSLAGGGSLRVNADGSLDFTPPAAFTGVFTFQYTIDNGVGTSTATVEINVAVAPIAVDDTIQVSLGTSDASNNVMTNDNLGAPPATVGSFGGGSLGGLVTDNAAGTTIAIPASGGITISIAADGTITVDATAATAIPAVYTVDYQISNILGSSTASLTINVVQGPIAEDDSFMTLNTVTLNGDLTVDNGFGADFLGVPAYNTLTFGGGDLGGTVTSYNAGTSAALAGGTLTVNLDGSFSLANPTVAGIYTFEYQIGNTLPASDSATVTIEVGDAPIAQDDSVIASVNLVNNFAASALFNDNGSGADYLGYPLATLVSFGGGSLGGAVTTNTAGASVAFAGGTLTVNADGSFVVSNPTTSGSYTFQYRIQNTIGFDDGTVTIITQEAPLAQPDTISFLYTADQISPSGLFADNGNGPDVLGFPPSTLVSFGGGSLGGTVATNAAGASVPLAGGTLTVNADGSWSLVGQPFVTGTYTFDYELDNGIGTSTATVTLNIQQLLIAVDDFPYVVISGNSLTINTSDSNDLLDNDTLGYPVATLVSFGGGSLGGTVTDNAAGSTVSPIPAYTDGSLTVNADGSFTFTPPTLPTRFCADFTFEYRIDNTISTDDGLVTITVQCGPIAEDDLINTGFTSGPSGYSLSSDLSIDNGSGADYFGNPTGQLTSFGGGSLGGNVSSNLGGSSASLGGGTLTVNNDGTFSLTNATTPGTYTFNYRLTNVVGTDDATVTIVIDTPPQVTSTNPLNGAVDVDPATDITINFSENVDITAGGVTIECPVGSPVTFTGIPTVGVGSVVLNPNSNLPFGTSCTVTVVATDVTDSDLIDSPDQLDGNGDFIEGDNYVFTFTTKPEAIDDIYAITPHLSYDSASISFSVLDNDLPSTSTITGFGDILGNANANVPNGSNFITASGAGGRVILNVDGTVLYYPDAGDSNTSATFFYTINGGDTAQVTLNIANQELVWFVDTTPGTTVCTGTNVGTQACPDSSVLSVGAVDTPSDTIFIASGNHTCGITLETNEIVVGDGSSSDLQTVSGVVPLPGSNFNPYASFSGTDPVLTTTTSGLHCFTLATGNTIRGVTIADVGVGGDASDIFGNNFGNFTLLETSLINTGRALGLTTGTIDGQVDTLSVTQSSNEAVLLSAVNGTLAVSTSSTISGITNEGIRVESSGVSASFGDTTVTKTTAGNAIYLNNNTVASDITFGGASNLFTVTASNGNALLASNHAGSINTNGLSGSSAITATNGACLDIDGPAGLTSLNFQVNSCTANNTTSYGIRLQDTAGTIFRIDNATNISMSGGNEGILLENADTSAIDISFGSTATVSNRSSNGIRVSNSNGGSLFFGNSTVNNPNAVSAAAIRLNTNTVLTAFEQTNINQGNVGGADEYSAGASRFPTTDNGGLGDAISVNTHTGGLTINGGTIQNVSDDGIDIRASSNLNVNNLTINHGLVALSGIAGIQTFNLTGTNNITNSTLLNADNPITCTTGQVPSLIMMTWNGANGGTVNVTGTNMDANTAGGICSSGVNTYFNSSGTANVNIGSNASAMTVQHTYRWGIISDVQGVGLNGTFNIDVTNLNMINPATGGWNGIFIRGRGTNTLTFDIDDNQLTDWSDDTISSIDIGIRIWLEQNLNAGDGAAGGLVSSITNNVITDTGGNKGSTGIEVNLDDNSDLDVNITGNIVSNVDAPALNIFAFSTWAGNGTPVQVYSANNIFVQDTAAGANNFLVDIRNGGTAVATATGNLYVRDNNNLYDGTNSTQSALRFSSRNGTSSYVANNNTYLVPTDAGTNFGALFQNVLNNTPTFCVDLNDDGGGGNSSNGLVRLQQTAGTFNVENGNTAAALNADNPAIAVANWSFVGTITSFVGECANANP